MYYVLQVASGTEAKTEAQITAILSDTVYDQCFHPTRHMRKKFHGQWKDIHEKLLPGYIFITTEDVKGLFMELKKVPTLTKLLGRDGEYFVALQDKDVEWLERLLGNGGESEASAADGTGGKSKTGHEAALSQVEVTEGNEIRILSGPLKNMDGMIKKINLHKRIAEVEVEFMKRKTIIYLGIELLGKK